MSAISPSGGVIWVIAGAGTPSPSMIQDRRDLFVGPWLAHALLGSDKPRVLGVIRFRGALLSKNRSGHQHCRDRHNRQRSPSSHHRFPPSPPRGLSVYVRPL